MYNLKVFSLPNYIRAAEVLPRERRRATFRHIARVEYIVESDCFPHTTGTAEEVLPQAFFVIQVLPGEVGEPVTLAADRVDALRDAAVEVIGGVQRGQWHQDGVTFADSPGPTADAVTLLRDGGAEIFTRYPFYSSGNGRLCAAPAPLEERIMGAALAAGRIAGLYIPEEPTDYYIDVSGVGVRGVVLHPGPRAVLRLLTAFDRDHIHLTWTLTRTEATLEEDLAPFFDAICQAGGLSASPGD